MKIEREELNKIIHSEARSLLNEIASERRLLDLMDKIAQKIENSAKEDEEEEVNPYEEILVKIVQYLENETAEETLKAVGEIYDVDFETSET